MAARGSGDRVLLKKGEGRLGATAAASSSLGAGQGPRQRTPSSSGGKPSSSKRTLSLKKPGVHDRSIDDDEPTSYSGIHARHSVPRPTSAPHSPAGVRRPKSAAGGDREAALLLLQGMDEGVFTSKSAHSLPGRRTAGNAALRAAANAQGGNASPGSSAMRKRDNQREMGSAVEGVMGTEMERGVVRRRMEGWYADGAAPESAGGGGASGGEEEGAGAVDFSPVLAALQSKLASQTRENIALRERVQELEEGMAGMDDEYKRRMSEAVESVSQEKREEVRHVVQSIRVRARQEGAYRRSVSSDKQHEAIIKLERRLRAQRQEALAAEGVHNLVVERLKKEKAELQERVRTHVEDPSLHCAACHSLRLRNSELERELSRLRVATPRNRPPPPQNDASTPHQSHPPRQAARGPSVRGRLQQASRSPRKRGGEGGRSAGPLPPKEGGEGGGGEEDGGSFETPDHSPPRGGAPQASPLRDGEGGRAAARPLPSPFKAGQGEVEGTKRTLPNGALEVTREDGSRVITFKDGTVKELTTDGRLVVRFANGDVKEECSDGTVTYFYREARTTHITYKSGLQLLHFPDNQMEKHYPDGSKEVLFPDKSRRRFLPSGEEETNAWI